MFTESYRLSLSWKSATCSLKQDSFSILQTYIQQLNHLWQFPTRHKGIVDVSVRTQVSLLLRWRKLKYSERTTMLLSWTDTQKRHLQIDILFNSLRLSITNSCFNSIRGIRDVCGRMKTTTTLRPEIPAAPSQNRTRDLKHHNCRSKLVSLIEIDLNAVTCTLFLYQEQIYCT